MNFTKYYKVSNDEDEVRLETVYLEEAQAFMTKVFEEEQQILCIQEVDISK